MKTIKVNSKLSNLLAKGIKALLLLVVLQGDLLCSKGGWSSQKGEAYQLANEKSLDFYSELQKRYENKEFDAIFQDKTGQSLLYILVKQGKKADGKLSEFFTFCDSNKSDPILKEKFTKALNASDPKSRRTPIGESIWSSNQFAFNILLRQEGIDINGAGEKLTSFVLALKKKQHGMADTLLRKDGIDIETKDPDSGNTPLHFSIKNKWWDITTELIELLKKKNSLKPSLSALNKSRNTPLHKALQYKHNPTALKLIELSETHALDALFIQNKANNTPLHLAMSYDSGTIPDKLIEVTLKHNEEKLWIQNAEENTALDLAIQYGHSSIGKLINLLPLEKINEPLIRKIVHKSKTHPVYDPKDPNKSILLVGIIMDHLSTLAKDNPTAVVNKLNDLFKLSEKDSIWHDIIFSSMGPGLAPVFSKINEEIFASILTTLKKHIKGQEWDRIENGLLEYITSQKDPSLLHWFKGKISENYADKLSNKVKIAPPA